jgi:hypothetical protein
MMNMKTVRAVIAAFALLALPVSAGAEIIDRILAVVGGELILLSDANLARRLGLVPAPASDQDADRAALDALIERQLELTEVNRYLPAEPTVAEIQARLAAVRSRFASDEELDKVLTQYGLTREQLRLRLRDDLRIEGYISQRFDAAAQPSDEEVLEYYRAHESEFTKDGAQRPYSEVRDEVKTRLVRDRRAAAMREWLAGLRRRVEISDLYLSGQ